MEWGPRRVVWINAGQAVMGFYRSSVDEMHEDYIRPQENGSHADCDYVKLTSKEQSVTVVSPHSFSFFSITIYTGRN